MRRAIPWVLASLWQLGCNGERPLDAVADGGSSPSGKDAARPGRDGGAERLWYTWLEQFGSEGSDQLHAVRTDAAGDVIVAGVTYAALPGLVSAGGGDILVAKLSGDSGELVWQQQFGTALDELAAAVAVDGRGDVFIAGRTAGVLGDRSFGQTDALVAKLRGRDGERLWLEQFGSDAYDDVEAMVVNEDGDCFLAGYSDGVLAGQAQGQGDAFLARRAGETGDELWTVQFGSEALDVPLSLALEPSGDLVMAGHTEGDLFGATSLGSGDAFVSRHSAADGARTWSASFGTPQLDVGRAVAVDADGAIYLVGETEGTLGEASAGNADAFVSKWDGADGGPIWTRQFGTDTWDFALSVAVTNDALAVSGDTYGALAPDAVKGRDVFLAFVATTDGAMLVARQFGTVGHDFSREVASDSAGDALVVGTAAAGLEAGLGVGSFDAFVAKVPHPSP